MVAKETERRPPWFAEGNLVWTTRAKSAATRWTLHTSGAVWLTCDLTSCWAPLPAPPQHPKFRGVGTSPWTHGGFNHQVLHRHSSWWRKGTEEEATTSTHPFFSIYRHKTRLTDSEGGLAWSNHRLAPSGDNERVWKGPTGRHRTRSDSLLLPHRVPHSCGKIVFLIVLLSLHRNLS